MPLPTLDHDSPQARRGRRLTLWLALLAGGFYVGYLTLAILRARG